MGAHQRRLEVVGPTCQPADHHGRPSEPNLHRPPAFRGKLLTAFLRSVKVPGVLQPGREGGKNRDTPPSASSSSFLLFSSRLAEFRQSSRRVLECTSRIGMSSILDLFCTARSFVIDLCYRYLYLHDLCPVVSDIDFMISLMC